MGKELTYILGAGASFQSIPVVKSFLNRFQSFNGYLERHSTTRFGDIVYESFKDAYKESKKLLEAFRAHQSFDTYFKKLFHTGEASKIFLSKKILNLYFLWEHLSKSLSRPQNVDETVFWKQSTIDKRYDALIAGLLKPKKGKAEPYCPINFITWNYDLNLFLSLKNYFFPDETIGSFLNHIKIKGFENVWKVDDQITIINMNGYFYSTFFSHLSDFTNIKKEIHEFIGQKLNDRYFSIDYTDNDAELIKFAWESNQDLKPIDIECVKHAKEKIQLSDNIVVIGYTFPLYNRLIDFEYFNRSDLMQKKVYIQDPNAIEVKESLYFDFNLSPQEAPFTVLKEIINCDSFFVPSNIYKF